MIAPPLLLQLPIEVNTSIARAAWAAWSDGQKSLLLLEFLYLSCLLLSVNISADLTVTALSMEAKGLSCDSNLPARCCSALLSERDIALYILH